MTGRILPQIAASSLLVCPVSARDLAVDYQIIVHALNAARPLSSVVKAIPGAIGYVAGGVSARGAKF